MDVVSVDDTDALMRSVDTASSADWVLSTAKTSRVADSDAPPAMKVYRTRSRDDDTAYSVPTAAADAVEGRPAVAAEPPSTRRPNAEAGVAGDAAVMASSTSTATSLPMATPDGSETRTAPLPSPLRCRSAVLVTVRETAGSAATVIEAVLTPVAAEAVRRAE